MDKKAFSFYKFRLFYDFTHPLFYVCALILNVFSAVNYFILGSFFRDSNESLNVFFSSVSYVSIIVIPVLCINAFSSYEKLLPLSKFSLESVKTVSVLTEFFVILVPSFFVPLSVSFFTSVVKAEVLLGFLFLLLYAFSSVSFCFMIQSFTENRALSFIFSIIFIAFFNSVQLFAQAFSSSSIFSRALKSVSLSWHFDSAGKGIFSSKDFVFFLSISFLFMFFNCVGSEKRAGKKYSRKERNLNLWVFALIIFVLLDGNRFYFRKDFTIQKRYSLSSFTKNLLEENSENINITYYRSKSLSSLYSSVNDITELLNEYALLKNVSLKITEPEKEGEAENLIRNGIFPRQLQSSKNGRTEYVNVFSAIVIERNGEARIIPFILDARNTEYLVTEKLSSFIKDEKRFVNILLGGNETLESYSYLNEFLSAEGFSVNFLDNSKNIPSEIQKSKDYGKILLVLGSEKLSEDAVFEIEDYLESGRRVFFAVSPYEKDINETWRITESKNKALLNLIESFGIEFSGNIVKDISCKRILMQDENSSSQYINYPLWIEVLPQKRASQGLSLFWPVSLNLDSENAFPVLQSSSYSYEIKPTLNSPESLFQTNPFLVMDEGFSKSAEKKSLVLAAEYKGEWNGFYNPGTFRDINFELVSDQYFLNSLMLGYIGGEYGDFRNLDFIAKELLRLNGEEELSEIYEKSISRENGFFKTPDQESFEKRRKLTFILNFFASPLIFVLMFISFSIYRKKRK